MQAGFRYAHGESFVHRLHPVVKISSFILIAVSAFMFGPVVSTFLTVCLLVLFVISGSWRPGLGRAVKPVPVFVILIIAANVILAEEGMTAADGAVRGLIQGLKVLVLALSASLLLSVTDPLRLSDSVLGFLGPFKAAREKREELALAIMIVMSFIPHIAEEADRIGKARMVRCGRGKWFSRRTGGVVPFLAPLIASAVRRADELDLALSAKYYGMKGARRKGRRTGISISDFVALAVMIFIFLAGIYAKYKGYVGI